MNSTIEEIMEKLSPAERDEVETRAAELIAEEYERRAINETNNPTAEKKSAVETLR